MTAPTSIDTCETLGVTPTVVGIIGALAASEAMKRVLGSPTRILGHLLTVDLAGPDFIFTPITKREKCGVCNGSPPEPVHPDNVVMLCGDNAANILPGREMIIDPSPSTQRSRKNQRSQAPSPSSYTPGNNAEYQSSKQADY
jgi:hypothetical protein